MTAQDTTWKPYYILAFRQTNQYPSPGTLVSIDTKIVEDHVEEISNKRDPYFKVHAPVLSKMSKSIPGKNDIFVTNEAEINTGHKMKTALMVSEIIPAKPRGSFYLKCHLSMIAWPADVLKEDQYIYVDADESTVIEPTLCDTAWTYEKSNPDFQKTFGIPMTFSSEGSFYRTYKSADLEMAMGLRGLILEFGMKEYSVIMPQMTNATKALPPAPQQTAPQQTAPIDHASKANDEIISVDEIDFEAERTISEAHQHVFEQHPLSDFSEEIFVKTLILLQSHKINITKAFKEDFEDMIKETTLDTRLKIASISEDYEEEDEK